MTDQTKIFPLIMSVKFEMTHKIHCKSDTEPEWFHNDVPLLSTYKTKGGWLKLTKVDRCKRGVYTCRGTTRKGEIFYSRSILKVLSEL